MVTTIRNIFTLLFIMLGSAAFAQSGGIYGTITNDQGQPEFGVTVEVSQGGIVKGGGMTDADGEYIAKPLSPGNYDVKISAINYKTTTISGVTVTGNSDTKLNQKLEKTSGTNLENVEVVAKRYEKPLLNDKQVVSGEEINRMATRNTQDIVATQAQVYQRKQGEAVSIAGGRGDANVYIVDGVVRRSNNGINLPVGTIAQVQVFNSGIPAMYGDATGGVTAITTRGVARQYQGGLLYERSVEGYGHNLLSLNLSGPFVSKERNGVKRPVAGFLLGIEGFYDKDDNPSYVGNYYVKEDKLRELEANPLLQIQTNSGGLINTDAAQFVNKDDWEYSKARRNAQSKGIRGTGKLDFALTDNVTLTMGGTYNYGTDNNYSLYYSLFSLERVPITKNYTAGGYLRLTQRFGRGGQEEKSAISNAYYTLQADYQKEFSSSEHPVHKKNIFDYNYMGKFFLNETNFYDPVGRDDSLGLPGVELLTKQFPGPIRFEASDKNPLLARFTENYFEYLNGGQAFTTNQIRAGRGLLNGDRPQNINSGFANVGVATNGYSSSQVEQVAVAADASFDLTPGKTRHAIQFGLYYQQRTQRGYSLTSSIGEQNSLWQLMRSTTNAHLSLGGDPIFIVNGKQYTLQDVKNGVVSPNALDTIIYNTIASGNQSNFDRNLREKLGLGASNTDYLNVDEMDPSTFSVDMFSADELLNNGRPFVNYFGYDYLGNKLQSVSFNDYWSKRDAKGNYSREIGAFRPNYIAGYIQDNFRFKDIEFRVGVRVDRYDANTKVLKDPYSLYETFTAGDVDPSKVIVLSNDGTQPQNIGSDYVPYVDNNESARPRIIGYRNGDDWYDANGNLIADPNILREVNGGNNIFPYLTEDGRRVKISDSSFNPNGSFTDYKPQVNVSPRIAFRFPIADQTSFFAHYDVLVQRPTGRNNATPDDYFFLAQNAGTTLSNPDLKPQKTFDYEFGFQQALNKISAITLTGFYRERKDMIQLRQYFAAWPVTYNSYGNRDFSTTKGLTLKFDRRRSNHLEFQVNYTLQFADGTGSNDQSTAGYLTNIIAAGLPNLRITSPLSNDSRHNFVALIDYRFRDNDGPEIFGSQILQNSGINFIFKARSGEPYTAYAQPQTSVVKGSIFGSRLPFHYMLDLKADKDLAIMKKRTEKGKDPLYINVFCLIQNVLNIRDVLGVYGYTSKPDDDGYINSPQGQQQLDALYPGQLRSYSDMYYLQTNSPNNYNLPRRINLGLSLNF